MRDMAPFQCGLNGQNFCETAGLTEQAFEKCFLLDSAGKAFTHTQGLGNAVGVLACRAAHQIPVATHTVNGKLAYPLACCLHSCMAPSLSQHSNTQCVAGCLCRPGHRCHAHRPKAPTQQLQHLHLVSRGRCLLLLVDRGVQLWHRCILCSHVQPSHSDNGRNAAQQSCTHMEGCPIMDSSLCVVVQCKHGQQFTAAAVHPTGCHHLQQ